SSCSASPPRTACSPGCPDDSRRVRGQSPGTSRGAMARDCPQPWPSGTVADYAVVTIEPLDDYLVVEPLDESETASGLIVPINEAAQCATGIVASVGPDVSLVEPGDKVLYPREAGYEVRIVRSSHRVRVLKREDLIARIHD